MDKPKEFDKFLTQMLFELESNAHKGDFDVWQPTPRELVVEINHHLEKLNYCIFTKNPEGIREYAADLANYCLKAYSLWGKDLDILLARNLNLNVPKSSCSIWQELKDRKTE